jgi:hypothetical protein
MFALRPRVNADSARAVNWGHPFAQGLRVCWLPFDPWTNHATGVKFNVTTPEAFIKTSNSAGLAYYNNFNNGARLELPTGGLQGGNKTEFTTLAVNSTNLNGSNSACSIALGPDGTTTYVYHLTTFTGCKPMHQVNSNYVTGTAVGGADSDGKAFASIMLNSVAQSRRELWQNGWRDKTGTAQTGTGNLVWARLFSSYSTNRPQVCPTNLILLWERALEYDECLQLIADPFMILLGRRVWIPVSQMVSGRTADASIVDGADTVTAAGALGIVGAGTITDGADATTLAVAAGIAGGLSIEEMPDALTGAAAAEIGAAASIVDGGDQFADVGAPVDVEEADVEIVAAATVVDGQDAFEATATVGISANAASEDYPDATEIAGNPVVGGSATVRDGADETAADASALIIVEAALIESALGVWAAGGMQIAGSLEAFDLQDRFAALAELLEIPLIGVRVSSGLVNRAHLASGVIWDVTIASGLANKVVAAHCGIANLEVGSMLTNRITMGVMPAPL